MWKINNSYLEHIFNKFIKKELTWKYTKNAKYEMLKRITKLNELINDPWDEFNNVTN